MKRVLAAVLVVMVLSVGAFAWYVSDYSHADEVALAVIADEDGASDGVTVKRLSAKAVAFVPDEPKAGLVFYPGGKVEPAAYAPLLAYCAQEGTLCVLVEPLFNLAFFDAGVADGVQDQFPQVTKWMIGGHSLGGIVASEYAGNHADAFDGVVFLAAYPSEDLSDFPGESLSIVGTCDEVLDRDTYEKASELLPAHAHNLELEGGNHAHFGNYGEQDGDGEATISREEQQRRTAAAIHAFMH